MTIEKTLVAQCVRNYYPFVANLICNLQRYKSIIFTYESDIVINYPGLQKYNPYDPEHGKFKVLLNRTTRKVFESPWLFRQVIRHNNVKMLHAHFAAPAYHFLGLKHRFGLRMIVTCGGFDVSSYPLAGPEQLLRTKLVLRDADLILTVSEEMKTRIINNFEIEEDNIIVHHRGVDLERFRYAPHILPTDKIQILAISNFVATKGYPVLIRAFQRVKQVIPNVHLRLVGKPQNSMEALKQKKEVEDLIDNFELEKDVTFTGFIKSNEIHREFEMADIFVLPCVTAQDGHIEGIPNVLMEAQACGLPVVSTYHGGIPEVVVDGKSGYLVQEGDVGALADKLCLLLRQSDSWPEMGKAGRLHIEKEFNLKTQVQRLEEIYDNVLAVRN